VFAASALLTFVGYLFVPYSQGHGWGYRYFHSAWLVLPLLAVAACRQPLISSRLAGYLAACALASLAVMTLFRAEQTAAFVTAHLAQLPRTSGSEARIVIVHWRGRYYAEDLVQNDPFLRTEPILMLSNGVRADFAMMARRFPQYRLIAMDGRGSVWGPR
jgi:hypothetical protein